MEDSYEIYHQKIIAWSKEFNSLPKSNFITSAVILAIGIFGLVLLIINPQTPYFLDIFVVSTFIGGIWFSITLSKMLKLIKIRQNLKILLDYKIFVHIMNSIVKFRSEKKGKDSHNLLKDTLENFGINSKYLIIELNRLALEMQRKKNKN